MPATDRLKAALSDRYVIEREIGAGGMATVYLARDLKHDREVALKVLRADLSAVIGTERFLEEVRITARLDHPHILTLIDSGSAEGILYYVLPFVRGESLRSKLEREKQLGVDEALSIIRQVASALDYAHERGVVHRDIKPENILLHEGEAVLADFGIALAVKEAGGNRLTETGLSLGTPQYMSPEQATGDRALDKRSDIYSLAAVFYEMISGEPPVTGATAQAMIAKLLTERPVRLRVVRPTISLAMESATEKALAKVPADRFSSAGEFVRALSVTAPDIAEPKSKKNLVWAAIGVVAAALIGFGLYMAGHGSAGPGRTPVTLRDRTQITNTGNIRLPTISPDGKTLTYVVQECSTNGCRFGLEMQDIGGTSRRLFDGASGIYSTEIGADRRNVIVLASIKGVFGNYLVPTLGGTPRLIVKGGQAVFWSGGDSLLIMRETPPAKTFWILVSGLDGNPVDSIRIDTPADRDVGLGAVPNSQRILYALSSSGSTKWYSIDRAGKQYSTLDVGRQKFSGGGISADALWMAISTRAEGIFLVRHAFNAATGVISPVGDTVYTGPPANFSVTADGSAVVLDETATEFSGWALSFDDVIKGRFTDDKRVFRSTTRIRFSLSADGSRLAFGRAVGKGDAAWQWTVTPFPKGQETTISGTHTSGWLSDSATMALVDVNGSSTTLSFTDVMTGRRSGVVTVPDRNLTDIAEVGNGGWAWIPPVGNAINVQRSGEKSPRVFKLPSWYKNIFWLDSPPGADTILFIGWKAPSEDSLGIGLLSLADGKFTQVWSTFGEGGASRFLNDGSVLLMILDTPESATFYRSRFDGKTERLGSTPRPTTNVTMSRDLKHAFAVTKDSRGDAWMSKVVR